MSAKNVFVGFFEGDLNFPPTYKYKHFPVDSAWEEVFDENGEVS